MFAILVSVTVLSASFSSDQVRQGIFKLLSLDSQDFRLCFSVLLVMLLHHFSMPLVLLMLVEDVCCSSSRCFGLFFLWIYVSVVFGFMRGFLL